MSNYLKLLSLFLSAICFNNLHATHGFPGNTLVQTDYDDSAELQSLTTRDFVLSCNFDKSSCERKRIIAVHTETAKKSIQVEINTGTIIYAGTDHLWFSNGELVKSQNLKEGQNLDSLDNFITVKNISEQEFDIILYTLTVEDNANFYITKEQILVHNIIFFFPLFTWVIGEGIALATFGAIATTAATVAVVNAMERVGADVAVGDDIGPSVTETRRHYEAGEQVDLDRFSNRVSQSGRGPKFADPKTGEYIEKDDLRGDSHGGSYWKLKDHKDARIASLTEDGKILRK